MIPYFVFVWVGVFSIVVLFFCLSIVLSDSQEGVVALCCLVGNSRTLIGLHEFFLLLFLRLPRKGEFQSPESASVIRTYILLDVGSCAKN